MAQPYIGEIRLFAGNYAPQGWALCDGSLLSISHNDALFSVIGTTFGGDGIDTFALPDLRGRVPVHWGSTASLGAAGGTETVTLTTSEIPIHDHPFVASSSGGATSPVNNFPGASAGQGLATCSIYEGRVVPDTTLAPNSIQSTGQGRSHDNMQPFLAITFIIALGGTFPSLPREGARRATG